ncbi:cytochrome c oxidase assembly protein [Aureimonas pseudogalii]|uniref:Putative membrane protein n=1 Tax=Aureimonas pseudogalii TaxID=1744844 RepID=A0A7W6H351_9HYPH|nr:cytochrome c oxidase assembly protein [Aureimonas pseudogalii]MBB3996513.1 putative membrane protein [Aureimonas pseudogalii]
MTGATLDRRHSGLLARFGPLGSAVLLLALLWGGPLPERAEGSFAAHMVMHMGVVALAAPLAAFGLARAFPGLVRRVPGRFALLAALAEFLLVWGWHAPALHDAARQSLSLLLLEQASFLAAGLFVWLTAFGAAADGNRTEARAAGAAGLLVTSMHMTLLGALLLLAPRALYACAQLCTPFSTLTAHEDQQLGGVLMLAIGGSAYLVGGLVLLAGLLNDRRAGGGLASSGHSRP